MMEKEYLMENTTISRIPVMKMLIILLQFLPVQKVMEWVHSGTLILMNMHKCMPWTSICKTNYIFMSLQLHVKCVESKAPLKPSSPGPSASVVCHAHVHTHPMQRNLQFLHGFRWECLAKYFLPTFIRTVIKFLCVFVLREGHPLGSHHTNCL